MPLVIACGECSWPLPAELWNRVEGARCPGCRQPLEIAVFPAIERTRGGALPQPAQGEGEASCFFHLESRAVTPCDECGRFLCSLCDIEIDGRHFCPTCFKSGMAANRLENVETRRTMYDTIALVLATLPLMLFWPAIIGAPAALFTVVRRWRAPLSILPRTRIRFYLAALFASAEIAGIVALVWAILRVRPGPS
ncbi:MAG TPA: hypothetical protein VKX39_00040 [Bryobacteraceae bacterium]|jgi:hypothetical protein|nr:hypothetical protein [Bryobacteraceae bacterium]